MNYRRLVIVLTLISAGASVWFSLIAHGHSAAEKQPDGVKIGFQVGERAPEFKLRSLDGRSVRLSNLRGKPLLLNFWATWCAPCRVETPWLVQLDTTYRAQGIQIIGVAMGSNTEEVAAFARERGVQYQVLLGTSAMADEYGGVRFMPQSFFMDRDGKITKTTTGLTDKRDIEDGIKALLAVNSKAQLARGRRS